MDFREIPASLGLDATEWSLLLGFFTFAEEPIERLSHLCQMEGVDVDACLGRLVAAGLVRERLREGVPHYSLAPLEDWMTGPAPGGDAEQYDMEQRQIRRLRELRGLPSIVVIGSREVRDRRRLDPYVVRWTMDRFPHLDLRLGTKCNLNCVYCLLGHEQRYMRTVDDLVAEMMRARRQNLEKVSFTGGEPTLHKDLLRLVQASRAMGFRKAILVTNGVTLSYDGRLERLLDAGVTDVGISFDSADRETSEAMWQSPVFDRVVSSITAISRHPEVQLGTITVVTRMNYRQLPDLARWFVEVRKTIANPFIPNLDFVMPEENAWKNRHALVPRLTEVAGPVLEALAIAHGAGLPMTYRGFPACILPGVDRYNMDRYMTIFQIVETPEGPEFDRSLMDAFRTKGPDCRRCIHFRECNGVSRSYANLYGTDELRPVESAP